MSILVTGGFGHIGSWVCYELIKRGHKVIVLDRSRRNVSYLKDIEDKISFVSADVLDQASLYRIFLEQRDSLEGVIHIAGLMGGPLFGTNPRQNVYINSMGTVNMLEVSRLFDIKRFVYISSGSVYGIRDNIPLEDDPLTPADLYGAAKASAEFFGLQYAREYGLDFRAIRVYFAYGPGRFPSELYPLYKAIFSCLEGRTKISLPAGGDQSIDFTYIRDIARAICLLYETPDVMHRQYNVSSGICHEIPELIRKVAEYAEVEVELSIGPGRIMPRGPSIDSSRLRNELGFAPEYDLKKGVGEYVEWIRNVTGKICL
ncbi:MAG: SDR family NAD(P)-dependent oxidoreductase [Desulfobulbaceae bacterium]|nr:SDR family NAD(P)-dependent oxidoreductase [Desulfobulbaceae bacterium]